MNKLYLKKNNGFTPTPILNRTGDFWHKKFMFLRFAFAEQRSGRIGVSFANAKRGFTLVEALVAISILMVAIAAPMSLAQKGTGATEFSTDQMIATYLAQDAIEAVKNIRDEVALTPYVEGDTHDWLEKVDDCMCDMSEMDCDLKATRDDKSCSVDSSESDIAIQKGNYILYINKKNNIFYNYTNTLKPGTTQSKFSRKFNVSKTDMPGEALVRVLVWWGNEGDKQVYLKNYIYNYSNNENILD